MNTSNGPLRGTRVLEFAGMGPGPFGAMLLSDMGADVLCVQRPGGAQHGEMIMARGKRSITLDLKRPDGLAAAWKLIEAADVLVEGFRPGVMERLGIGPDRALARNPGIVYARMTGWGESGPLAMSAGHDINYMAVSGALAAIGTPDSPPVPPLNLVGDYGGGSMYLVFGITCALLERARSGRGQVVEAAMVDGIASLMANRAGKLATGGEATRGHDHLDGSAHYYRAYRCADGEFIAIGAIEPQFYQMLWEKLGWSAHDGIPSQARADWARGTEILSRIFEQHPRAHWTALFEGCDVCYAPVLPLDEAISHPQMQARNVYVERFGTWQPNVAPRLSRTPGRIQGPPSFTEVELEQVLAEWSPPVRSTAKP
ncbi:MAG TPA: CaiB/BaiF CoA-transferase family protein [Ramlibacter sp.]|nr:CaiB/BaiF CoA-transferase family protein [Ramlibacter sp.]